MQAELVNERLPSSSLGEGPHWDHRRQHLYWMDILSQKIHRYDPAKKEHAECALASTVGFAAMAEDGRLVAGLQDGIYKIDFGNCSAQVLVRPDYADPRNRFNDGKCDKRGRLWAGTMNHVDHAKPSGAFYRYDETGLHEQATGIYVSNGLGWSPDNKTMYYTDTGRKTIWAYDYDIETGKPANRREFVVYSGNDGKPDGMCVDSAGRLLVCLWDGSGVDIYDADGYKQGKIALPVPRVTCCAFGGKDLRTLYITTASAGLSEEELRSAPNSGRLFKAEMDIPGLPETPFRG